MKKAQNTSDGPLSRMAFPVAYNETEAVTQAG
jgi:hypothetical protein